MAALGSTASTLTDAGIGLLEEGWSIEEQITPNSIAGQNASTGSVGFAAQSTPGSSFIVNDQATFAHEGVGSVTGVIDSATIDNLRTSATQGTMLTRLNADLPDDAPIMGATGSLASMFAAPIHALLPTATVQYQSATNPTVTFPVWVGNVWDHLNQLAAATGREIAAVGDAIVIRDVGAIVREFPHLDAGARPRIQVNTQAAGQSIEIEYQRCQRVIGGLLYDARTDDNRQFQVDYMESSTTSVVTTSYPTSLIQPVCVDAINPYDIPPLGTYCVSAADGLPVPAEQWRTYGGSLSVAVGDTPNVLDVTLTGPRWRIPGAEGPYRIGVTDGATDYAVLSVNGNGTITDPRDLVLLTGADPRSATKQVATRIENLFISTLGDAYSRGVWASADAAGPTVTLSFTAPLSSLDGLGLTCGALARFADSIFRINTSRISRGRVAITAMQHTTAGDLSAVWAGETAGAHAAHWEGLTAGDANVRPLRR